jgi:chemotaxis response regulator CheB
MFVVYATVHSAPEIVAIVGSAGAVEALYQLLGALPPYFPCPIVLVQHLPGAARYKSVLDEVLGRATSLPVKWAEHGEQLCGQRIFLAPQDFQIEISDRRRVNLTPAGKMKRTQPSADPLFRSMATVFGRSAVSVVLSGALWDGAQGAFDVAKAGGWVLVQDCATAIFGDMPRSTLSTGAVDFSLSPLMIAHALVTLALAPGAAEWFRGAKKSLQLPESPACPRILRASAPA